MIVISQQLISEVISSVTQILLPSASLFVYYIMFYSDLSIIDHTVTDYGEVYIVLRQLKSMIKLRDKRYNRLARLMTLIYALIVLSWQSINGVMTRIFSASVLMDQNNGAINIVNMTGTMNNYTTELGTDIYVSLKFMQSGLITNNALGGAQTFTPVSMPQEYISGISDVQDVFNITLIKLMTINSTVDETKAFSGMDMWDVKNNEAINYATAYFTNEGIKCLTVATTYNSSLVGYSEVSGITLYLQSFPINPIIVTTSDVFGLNVGQNLVWNNINRLSCGGYMSGKYNTVTYYTNTASVHQLVTQVYYDVSTQLRNYIGLSVLSRSYITYYDPTSMIYNFVVMTLGLFFLIGSNTIGELKRGKINLDRAISNLCLGNGNSTNTDGVVMTELVVDPVAKQFVLTSGRHEVVLNNTEEEMPIISDDNQYK
jgi:hypothetical protein